MPVRPCADKKTWIAVERFESPASPAVRSALRLSALRRIGMTGRDASASSGRAFVHSLGRRFSLLASQAKESYQVSA